ncbi:MAG: HAD family hydrolase [Proteobacteria bacterium]|nr:HAD family hydrolase [Pseudomonadota bacterium]
MRALLLDLDDTLFDRTAALLRWAARHGAALDHAWLVRLDERGRRPRLKFAAAIIDRLDLDDEPAAFAARFPHELAACIEPEPGLRAALAPLAGRIPIAVVTNGGDAQREKLRRTGLDDLVGAIFVSGELGISKPDPEIFARAARWANCDPIDCVFVGDDPELDLAPAAALGMTTAWRCRGAWPAAIPAPALTIRSVDDFARLA